MMSIDVSSEREAKDLHENHIKPRGTKARAIRGVDRLREGQLESLSDRNRDLLIQIVQDLQPVRSEELARLSPEAIVQRAETPEPATSAIKRLLRLPSSSHHQP